ncbi:MAG: SGNH/GDSL hydrolase family protein [Candidatus Saccharimonadaceae bacterium]
MKKKNILFFIFFTIASVLISQPVSQFKKGERVIFLGNSITDGGHYHSFIWLYYMTRFPNMDLHILNAGIGGNTVFDMYKRLDGDVFSKNPTTLVVTFGMNDSGYQEYNSNDAARFGEEKYRETYENFKLLEGRLEEFSGTKIVMMGGSPYDETAKIENNTSLIGKNNVMKRIVTFQKRSADENDWQFLDLNGPMTAINQTFQENDPGFTICGLDRIHPENDGHMVMAYLFLKEQGLDVNAVTDFEVNASRKSVTHSANCEISNVRGNRERLSFDYFAYSLPYPLDTIPRGWNAKHSQADAMKYVPFMEEMNREEIKVTDLDNGDYKMYIDGEEIGTWSSSDLSKGVNLAAETKTPQYQQALSIMHLNELRWEIERDFRDYAWIQYGFFQERGLLFANNRASLEALDKEIANDPWLKMQRENYVRMMHQPFRETRESDMDMIVAKIYEINQPKMRKITLMKN